MATKKDHVISSCFVLDQQMAQSGTYIPVSRFMFRYRA